MYYKLSEQDLNRKIIVVIQAKGYGKMAFKKDLERRLNGETSKVLGHTPNKENPGPVQNNLRRTLQR